MIKIYIQNAKTYMYHTNALYSLWHFNVSALFVVHMLLLLFKFLLQAMLVIMAHLDVSGNDAGYFCEYKHYLILRRFLISANFASLKYCSVAKIYVA